MKLLFLYFVRMELLESDQLSRIPQVSFYFSHTLIKCKLTIINLNSIILKIYHLKLS
jgi:hypothetical protein